MRRARHYPMLSSVASRRFHLGEWCKCPVTIPPAGKRDHVSARDHPGKVSCSSLVRRVTAPVSRLLILKPRSSAPFRHTRKTTRLPSGETLGNPAALVSSRRTEDTPLIAPRPLLIINGDSDPRTPIGGVRECMAAAEQAYKAVGASDRLVLHLQPNTGHQVTHGGQRAALAWFEQWLKPAIN